MTKIVKLHQKLRQRKQTAIFQLSNYLFKAMPKVGKGTENWALLHRAGSVNWQENFTKASQT